MFLAHGVKEAVICPHSLTQLHPIPRKHTTCTGSTSQRERVALSSIVPAAPSCSSSARTIVAPWRSCLLSSRKSIEPEPAKDVKWVRSRRRAREARLGQREQLTVAVHFDEELVDLLRRGVEADRTDRAAELLPVERGEVHSEMEK